MTDPPETAAAPAPRRDLRRGRGRAAVAVAGDQARAVAGPDPRPSSTLLGEPAGGLPGDPPDRHQRQDLDLADDRHPAARARPAHRAVHQPARRADDRADLGRRRAAERRGVRARRSTTWRRTLALVDAERGRTRCRSSRRSSAMAYARFAEAPVDVAVVEVGMGGSWDATNVADGAVAVVLPVAVDHAQYLGDSPAEIAIEKAGIIKPGAMAVLAEQQPDVAEVLLAPARRGRRHASCARAWTSGSSPGSPAVGGQVVSLQGLRARYDDAVPARCTAPTRPRTPPSPWPRSRRSSAATSRWTTSSCGRRSPR